MSGAIISEVGSNNVEAEAHTEMKLAEDAKGAKLTRTAVIPRPVDAENHTVCVITWSSDTVVNSTMLRKALKYTVTNLVRAGHKRLCDLYDGETPFGLGDLIHSWPDQVIQDVLRSQNVHDVNILVHHDHSWHEWNYDDNLIEEEAKPAQ